MKHFFRRLKLVFTHRLEIEQHLNELRIRNKLEEMRLNSTRLNLCHEHQQANPNRVTTEHLCDHCNLINRFDIVSENYNMLKNEIDEEETKTVKMKMKENEIFVFGSNLAGKHGVGAAKTALKFGAKFGVGEGIQGNTYALPTKDEHIKTLPLNEIQKHIDNFIQSAIDNPDKKFLVTRIGCGWAGYSNEEIAPMFTGSPDNVQFSTQWASWHPYHECWTDI